MAAIEIELSNDSQLDIEFDKHVLESNQLENDRSSRTFASVGAAVGPHANPLEAAANAVKKCEHALPVWISSVYVWESGELTLERCGMKKYDADCTGRSR